VIKGCYAVLCGIRTMRAFTFCVEYDTAWTLVSLLLAWLDLF
jgi:hypothetical protein